MPGDDTRAIDALRLLNAARARFTEPRAQARYISHRLALDPAHCDAALIEAILFELLRDGAPTAEG